MRAAGPSRPRALVAGAAAVRGSLPRAQAQASVRARIDDAERAGQRPPAQRADPSPSRDQPALSYGAPTVVPMASAHRPGLALGQQLGRPARASDGTQRTSGA